MEPTLINLDNIPADHRSGYVALTGRPNVGKSTLLNALMGRKLSIVTRKPQTTRHRILGILTAEGYQIIFLDTPGIIEPRYRLQEAMMQTVHGAVAEADLLLFMADASRDEPDTLSMDTIGERPAILVLNKMDLVPQEKALPLVEAYTNMRAFEAVVPISAREGRNLDVLLQEVQSRLPLGPPFYPADMVSEHPERFFVAEIIREKIFERFRQEVPYATQVNIVQYEERENGLHFIDAEIVAERDTQKAMIIGKKGVALKEVGAAARQDIERFVNARVYLQLHVKVRDNWRDRDTFLRSYGYST